jgi:hypothetical protein
MVHVQDAFRIAGWMVPAQHALKAVPMQHAKAQTEPDVSGLFL